jgi:hypothetical protein
MYRAQGGLGNSCILVQLVVACRQLASGDRFITLTGDQLSWDAQEGAAGYNIHLDSSTLILCAESSITR